MSRRNFITDDYDELNDLKKHRNSKKEETPLWDSFQDPPPKNASGSLASARQFEFWIKFLKVFIYLLVFTVVIISTSISKNLYILIAGHLKRKRAVRYCDPGQKTKELYANVSEVQTVTWFWTLIFAFSLPEIFTFFRAARICFFKNIRVPSFGEICMAGFMETLHTVGLAIFTFGILPEIDSVKGLLLTNCMSLIPGILCLLTSPQQSDLKSYMLTTVITIFAILFQVTGLVVWPLSSGTEKLWLLVPSLIFISFRWWENYLSAISISRFLGALAKMRENFTSSRYHMYLYIAPWKIFVFIATGIMVHGLNVSTYFHRFIQAWQKYPITISTNNTLYTDRADAISSVAGKSFSVASSPMAHIWIMLTFVVASYVTYIFGKFACKVKIQKFSFSLPLSTSVPASLILMLSTTGFRETNTCALHNILPDYLAFSAPSLESLGYFSIKENAWIWLLWLFSQAWITRHIWHPKNDRNASTEKLFIAPWYCSLLVDQCCLMNRRRRDDEDYVLLMDTDTVKKDSDTQSFMEEFDAKDIRPTDKIPQVLICATMWHEQREEMMEFLKSILRLDEDQCARRMARKYYSKSKDKEEFDCEYYELETHIFFDDAFILDQKLCSDVSNPPINEFVREFLTTLDEAASNVYETSMRIEPPTKIKTPYGGRLIWTLPGRTKMICHLKNKSKIRHKKRWSQVMYMYFLLGYRIMEMDASPQRKFVIAQNTYLLALDGDIDFQPQAVQLLIGRMKVDADLGAACGRIHPIGKGAMVWYQVFEYAIGHWLQKATEHVLGCVLCSPGCFSLFRGRALMENSVMRKYTTESKEARHHVQYDQGEDRWLCTLLLKQKFRVEYSAASDAYTHCPEGFNEFYNQRRRWVPSTIANIIDLLSDAKTIVKNNNSISTPYIYYQMMLLVGTLLGPGTIFLMMVGSLVAVFKIDIWTSFLWNFIPILCFMIMCYFCKSKYQLFAAFVISAFYSMVMMAVLIGIIMQVMDDGILSPASVFFFSVAAQIVITGLLHPQEMTALFYGIIYYITIPSMYMLLLIYSVFNLNDVSWGTRENAGTPNTDETDEDSRLPSWLDDTDLDAAKLESLSITEANFWHDLIKKYLTPIILSEEAAEKGRHELKELRDVIVFVFVMINSLFVLIVFLLQLNKSYLHIQWPFNAENTIEYDITDSQITLYRKYLELEPIGLLFVVFFGTILVLQFLAMLVHRFGTLSQILAATELNWTWNCQATEDDDETANSERIGAAVTLAKKLQRPRKQLEVDDSDQEEYDAHSRRSTIIHKIMKERTKTSDWNNLEANFKRRFNKDKDMNLDGIPISRKTKILLENHRKSIIAERRNTINKKKMNSPKERRYEYDNAGYAPSVYDTDAFEMTERVNLRRN